MSGSQEPTTMRIRREPPAFRSVTVRRVDRLSPRMVRVVFAGPDLQGLSVDQPAASVRLLLPSSRGEALVMPAWTGNEFLLPDGRRPAIRTFTPRHVDTDTLELALDFVVHGTGVASAWAEAATPGDAAAVSGPGRGYSVDADAPAFLLAGDETAIPAISQLLEALPHDRPAQVHVEVAGPDGRLELPHHPLLALYWHDLPEGAPAGDTIVAAIGEAEMAPGTRVWVAGEAAAVQRIRRRLFEERGVPRSHATIRGYWKYGRAGGADEA